MQTIRCEITIAMKDGWEERKQVVTWAVKSC